MPKKINVCMFLYHFPPHYSGAAKQAINLARKLREHRIRSFFVTVENGGLKRYEKYDGFDVYRIREGKGRMKELPLWWNLFKLLFKKRLEYDIIHSHGAYYKNCIIGPIGRLLKKGTIVKVSMANNDLSGMGKGFYGRLHKDMFKMTDSCISISSEITAELNRIIPNHDRIIEIPNGVDTDRFKPVAADEKEKLREKLKLPSGLMCLYVGGISKRKNVEWLVKTWSRLFIDATDVFLVMVGPVSREDDKKTLFNFLVNHVERYKLAKRIIFRDYTDSVEKYYQASDIFVLPSKQEGMPNVLIEAMSSGLVCITNKVSGASDLILDGETGLFFNTESETYLYEEILSLKDNPQKRYEVGETARRLVLQKYSLDKVSKKYVELYFNLLR